MSKSPHPPVEVAEFLSFPPEARAEVLNMLRALPPDAQSGKGPDAVEGSSGPTGGTTATPGPTQDTLGVPDRAEPRNGRFNAIAQACPHCGDQLRLDGACTHCKVQFVGISRAVVARIGFARAPEGSNTASDVPPTYRSFWDVDDQGCAIMCFQSQATGWRVWLPCLVNYLDSYAKTQTRFPYWINVHQLGGRTVQTLCDFTDEQFKERAAHLPGRITSEHMRKYDSDLFQRDYYWVWMDRPTQWQKRAERKAVILAGHRRAGCEVPGCTKQHRVPD
jgi:hypothetical protein